MVYEQKLNAITRLVFIATILGYLVTFSTKILISGIITIIIILFLYKLRKQKITNSKIGWKEGFEMNDINDTNEIENPKQSYHPLITITNPETLETYLKEDFQEGTKKNPFSNVLLTEYLDDPNRKAAPHLLM